ncbi:DUF1289 domain-containing protein [Cellvibrio sp.]
MTTIVESPCVRNCCLNEADICVGCFRSLEEITRWSIVDNEAKMQILMQVAIRRSQPRHKPAVGSGDADK